MLVLFFVLGDPLPLFFTNTFLGSFFALLAVTLLRLTRFYMDSALMGHHENDPKLKNANKKADVFIGKLDWRESLQL